MFWGLVLEPGKRYSTTVDKSFHVSMAALDCSSVKSDSEILSVILECEGQENILCNLSKQQKILQSHLDLNFMTGDKVSFEIKGSGIVHLSGYLVPEDDDDDDYMNMQDYEDMEEEEEEETEESPKSKEKQKGKRKPDTPEVNKSKKKKIKMTEEVSDDSDEEDEDEDENENGALPKIGDLAESSSDEDEEEDDDSDEEEDDSDEEDDDMADSDEEEEVQVPSKKQQKTPQSVNKKAQQTPNKQTPNIKQQQSANKQTPLLNGSVFNQQQSGKKNKKKNQGQETPKTPNQNDVKAKNQKTPSSESGSPQQKKTTLEGGIIVKDIREGNGPVAKNGQLVAVYYQGRLKSNNKMFDECKRGGPPFKFRLGKGEVIKGWDIGLNGMKVGGLRTISCPPNMAYGQKGSPPQIPPNSALVFQVELKSVN